MSLTAIVIADTSTYYLEGAEVHGDIVSPVIGDLAIYTYAPTGGFAGQEYSYSGSVWFKRNQLKKSADGGVGVQSIIAESELTLGTLAEMASDASGLSPANKGKRWQATDDNDRVYVYSLFGILWGYYLDTSIDASGNEVVSLAGTINKDGESAGLAVVESFSLIQNKRSQLIGSLGVGTGPVLRLSALRKVFQINTPAGSTVVANIEGSIDAVNFKEMASAAVGGDIYVSQEPIEFWRAVLTTVSGLPSPIFSAITVSEITGLTGKIGGLIDDGKYYRFSGTGIGSDAVTVGDYIQLFSFGGDPDHNDWHNIPFVAYKTDGVDQVDVYDPTGVDRGLDFNAVTLYFVAAISVSY